MPLMKVKQPLSALLVQPFAQVIHTQIDYASMISPL
jgi:hypothetical protein